MLRIIHVSDLHLESDSPSFQKTEVIEAFIDSLEKFITDDTIIAFTGDCINKGGEDFKNEPYAAFEEFFISPITKRYSKLKDRFFIVPGNHDVKRADFNQFRENPLRETFQNQPLLVDSFVKQHRINLEDFFKGIQPYKHFERNFYKGVGFDDTNWRWSYFGSSKIISVNDQKVGIACIDSSWLCYNSKGDKGKLFISREQLQYAINFIKNCPVKIAMIHHPFGFLNEHDFELIKPLVYKYFDVVLMGHTHLEECINVQDLDGQLYVSIAKSLNGEVGTDIRYQNGYSVVDLFPKERIEVTYKKYVSQHKTFVINTDIGNDEGKKIFHIGEGSSSRIPKDKTDEVIKFIDTERLAELSGDLIVTNAINNSQNNIADIFVEPTICNYPEGHLNDEDKTVKYYTVDSICESDKHHMIYGIKESGKTILLDKILIELTKNHNKYKKIPVFIKFQELQNKTVFQLARDFISQNSEVTKGLLKNKKFVLIIDDISIKNDAKFIIDKLLLHLKEFPNLQIISACLLQTENTLPIEEFEFFHSRSLNFESVFLHNLNAKQIRGLINNWFNQQGVDFHENLEKLIRGFYDLGLPRTPLAVTLFLSIINKQENRPINNSVLVELFVESLLEKTDVKNIYFNNFDFHNKQRLLASIAHYMLKFGDATTNYSADENKLIDFIHQYLQSRIPIKGTDILRYFLDRSILIHCPIDNTKIRFKSSFYFHYFLARYMDVNEVFREEVFTGDNYTKFFEEIEFYTGIKRDSQAVLEFVMKKLSDEFNEMNTRIVENHQLIDNILETKEPLSKQIPLAKAKIKPSNEELDAAYDQTLSRIPSNQDKIPQKISASQQDLIPIDKLLKLAAVVYKNSEEIDNLAEKEQALKLILQSSVSFMLLYREQMVRHAAISEKKPDYFPDNIDYNTFIRIIPILHQVTMYNWIGSAKILPVLSKKIATDKTNLTISEYEKFLTVFTYADTRGPEYIKIIEEYTKGAKKNYIKDSIFFKILTYYFLRSKTKESDQQYLTMLSTLQTNLYQLPKSKKGTFIQRLEKSKKRKFR